MTPEARLEIIDRSFAGLGDHDAPARECELVDYTFEFVLDYGAYRELKRHRMMSHLPQPLTVDLGYQVPDLQIEAGLADEFQRAVEISDTAFRAVQDLLALDRPVPGDPRPLPPAAVQDEPAGVLPPVQAADFRLGPLRGQGSECLTP